MIFTNPALCSENSVKFSTRSSRRARSHVPRSITSSDTRRSLAESEAENARLRAELIRVTEPREILKKSLGIRSHS